jgi:hypothetical protein
MPTSTTSCIPTPFSRRGSPPTSLTWCVGVGVGVGILTHLLKINVFKINFSKINF